MDKKMTAKDKINILTACLEAMAMIGKMDNEDGTKEEDMLLFELASLGCAMGRSIIAHSHRVAAHEHSTVTE